jgi:hypothetical protein
VHGKLDRLGRADRAIGCLRRHLLHRDRRLAGDPGKERRLVAADLLGGLAAVHRVARREPADGRPLDEAVRLLSQVEHEEWPAPGALADGIELLRRELLFDYAPMA